MIAPCLWRQPPREISLGNNEVHIWRVNLDRDPLYVQSIYKHLSKDEQKKAERFFFDKDRKNYIVARGFLRVVLSRYLDKNPNELRFLYNCYGKPRLLGFQGFGNITFNVSHSRSIALFVITRYREVGIDLEYILPDFDFMQAAEQFFSFRENAALREIPRKKERERAFYNCWTRKEAYIKARGEGLSLPLNQFDVSVTPGEPAKLLRHYGIPQEVNRWALKEIQIARGFVASLAIEGKDWHLTCFDAIS